MEHRRPGSRTSVCRFVVLAANSPPTSGRLAAGGQYEACTHGPRLHVVVTSTTQFSRTEARPTLRPRCPHQGPYTLDSRLCFVKLAVCFFFAAAGQGSLRHTPARPVAPEALAGGWVARGAARSAVRTSKRRRNLLAVGARSRTNREENLLASLFLRGAGLGAPRAPAGLEVLRVAYASVKSGFGEPDTNARSARGPGGEGASRRRVSGSSGHRAPLALRRVPRGGRPPPAHLASR